MDKLLHCKPLKLRKENNMVVYKMEWHLLWIVNATLPDKSIANAGAVCFFLCSFQHDFLQKTTHTFKRKHNCVKYWLNKFIDNQQNALQIQYSTNKINYTTLKSILLIMRTTWQIIKRKNYEKEQSNWIPLIVSTTTTNLKILNTTRSIYLLLIQLTPHALR